MIPLQPSLARGRESPRLPWQVRFADPPPVAKPVAAVQQLKDRSKTRAGGALYGLGKRTVGLVFGIIQVRMRFRQFLLRRHEGGPRGVVVRDDGR